MEPFNSYVDLLSGEVFPCRQVVVRRLSDMARMFQDQQAAQKLLQEGNPVIYRVFNVVVPEEYGHLQHCISVIFPGKVGQEYFMTKGHFHARKDTAEVYLTLRGNGILILQNQRGETRVLEMRPGSASYIPPFWAHRSVNVGKEPLVFFAVYPAEAGHDYEIIEKQGFAVSVIEHDGKPKVVANPGYPKGG